MRAEPVDKAEAMVEAMSDADALAMHAEHNKTAWWSAHGVPHEHRVRQAREWCERFLRRKAG
jgi:hypothetical protein